MNVKKDSLCKLVKFYTLFFILQPHKSLFTNYNNYDCFTLIRDAIFQASPQLSRKRRQIRLLDYWQFKVLHSALICFTNPASPNFFTGRAGFVLRTHTAHLPKSASWIIGVHKVKYSISNIQIKLCKVPLHAVDVIRLCRCNID